MNLNSYQQIFFIGLIVLGLITLPALTPFILLTLLVFMVAAKTDERVPFGISVFMIFVGAVFLYLNQKTNANQFGNYAFYLFIIGTLNSIYNNYLRK